MRLKPKPIMSKYAAEIVELYATELRSEVHEPLAAATVQPA
jgi:long-chain acyl-CoA synthetase